MKKLTAYLFSLIIIAIAFPVKAQKRKSIPTEKPQLIIGIVVEDMRYDYIYRYWENFGEGGFKKLIGEGALCRNANYNYMFTQTSPGLATIATGCEPQIHGIVADNWYLQLQESNIKSVEDSKSNAIGIKAEKYHCSPRNMLTTTFSDEMKLFFNGQSKIIGVSLNPESAILPVGHMANAAYWFDDESGLFVSSSYYMDSLPLWVNVFNNKKFPDLYIEREWTPSLPTEKYRNGAEQGLSRKVGFSNDNAFGKKIGGLLHREKHYSKLKGTPLGNSLTKDFCVSAIIDEQLGQDEFTDFLSISFSATADVSAACGPNSVELEDMYLKLDKDLEHFLQFIDDQLGKNSVLIYLTSDHGTSYSPTMLNQNDIPAGIFNADRAVMLLGTYLNALYDKGKWVSAYHNNQIYLNHSLIESASLNIQDFENKVGDFLLQFSGVANVVSASTLKTVYFTEGTLNKIQNSFNPKRSGDVIFSLEPGWIEQKTGIVSSSNSGYNYDTHVPLIWYGWRIKRARLSQTIKMEDIAPTISNILDVPSPNGTTGKVIEGLLN